MAFGDFQTAWCCMTTLQYLGQDPLSLRTALIEKISVGALLGDWPHSLRASLCPGLLRHSNRWAFCRWTFSYTRNIGLSGDGQQQIGALRDCSSTLYCPSYMCGSQTYRCDRSRTLNEFVGHVAPWSFVWENVHIVHIVHVWWNCVGATPVPVYIYMKNNHCIHDAKSISMDTGNVKMYCPLCDRSWTFHDSVGMLHYEYLCGKTYTCTSCLFGGIVWVQPWRCYM